MKETLVFKKTDPRDEGLEWVAVHWKYKQVQSLMLIHTKQTDTAGQQL